MAKGKAKSAKKASKSSKKKRKPILKWREDAPHLTVVGALVGAVLFTLILGAKLSQPRDERDTSIEMALSRPVEADSNPAPLDVQPYDAPPADEDLRSSSADPTEAAAPPQELAPPAETQNERPAAPVEPKPVRRGGLRNRTLTDASRLADASGWSLQFMVTCKADTAERVLADAGSDSQLYLLPVSLEGRDCYRVCWSTFPSREAAAASNEYPAALAALADPIPRPVSELR